ncbi:MAG: hypothetical protein IH901_06960 [Proteobacteria bacterium]|nr:hypothetical protein [Pseudomonadota bacterium]
MKKILLTLALMAGAMTANHAMAEESAGAPVCRATETGRALDFWAGDYQVISNDDKREIYGANLIERTLDGCAIIENWTSKEGSEGKSLFYFDARADTWTQVWVTGDTSKPWGLKVKFLVGIYDNGAVRFQSRQILEGGKSYLDRTTLTPMENGVLRQLIEISQNGGETWETTFDALYIPAVD